MPDKAMTKREEDIGRAARAERDRAMWTGDKLTPTDEYYRRIALAAVRAAYEIDGVDELVEAAQAVVSAYDGYEIGDGMVNLMNAIARVREASGS